MPRQRHFQSTAEIPAKRPDRSLRPFRKLRLPIALCMHSHRQKRPEPLPRRHHIRQNVKRPVGYVDLVLPRYLGYARKIHSRLQRMPRPHVHPFESVVPARVQRESHAIALAVPDLRVIVPLVVVIGKRAEQRRLLRTHHPKHRGNLIRLRGNNSGGKTQRGDTGA